MVYKRNIGMGIINIRQHWLMLESNKFRAQCSDMTLFQCPEQHKRQNHNQLKQNLGTILNTYFDVLKHNNIHFSCKINWPEIALVLNYSETRAVTGFTIWKAKE